jgi:dodecin
MSDHVYRLEKFVGSSPRSQDEALQNAIAAAYQANQSLRWYVVLESRGQISDGKIAHYQVTVEVGSNSGAHLK